MTSNSRPFSFLIVEIDPEQRSQIEGWIRETKLGDIHFAKNVSEALNVLETQPIDCIVATWELLGVAGGLSLLKLVKREERFQRIAFLMISSPSANEAEKVRSARAARADGYLLKPLKESAFKALLVEIHSKRV